MFESLKEWVPGEDTQTIDWKATARRGKVMARQYEDERRQQVLIVIDAGRMLTAESGGRPRLEAVVEAALQLAHGAIAHDDNVGLMVFADQIQRFVAPGRGRRALRAVLDGLAGIEGRLVEPDYPLAFATLAARTRRRALTVLFTDVIDWTASEALVAHTAGLRPRHLPLAVVLRDPAMDRLATVRPASSTERQPSPPAPESGWLSLPVAAGQKAAQCLRDAARVFGAAEKHVLDLRLSAAERALPARVGGPIAGKGIDEIRRLVFAIVRQEILQQLAEGPHDAWPDFLRPWPGRHALDISSPDGRYAAVYYAPNAGYQFEKINGQWTIVGG